MATDAVLSDLTTAGEECVVVEGGEGGLGNAALATASCRRTREFTEGSAGEERVIEMELKTIADVGMVRRVYVVVVGNSVLWIILFGCRLGFPMLASPLC